MAMYKCFLFALLLRGALAAPPPQVVLQEQPSDVHSPQSAVSATKKRPLYGRYLQITDFHPDPFYEVYSSTSKDDACHHGQGSAGIYGAETSDCDSPIALVNKTMEWVGKKFKDEIDFVIWTGDSARHDNDDEFPRSEDQVLDLNRLMVDKMTEIFGKHNGDEEDDDPYNDYVVPIIPNLGNNDILPHNIMRPGPNKWTRTYASLWKKFIPEEQKHQFEQGGWFYVEVIPGNLAVFSLNTLYFFASNAAADGCAQPSEPGFQQMEWLRIQLQFMRDRGMKAILIGHVPPNREDSKTSWDETCWQKYTLWLRQYRDIIVSSHYGHFNFDHLILQDFEDLRKGTKKGKMPDYTISSQAVEPEDDEFHAAVSSSYFIDLRDAWSKIPDPPESLQWMGETGWNSVTSCESPTWWCRLIAPLPEILKKSKKQKKEEKKFFDEIGGQYAERYAASFVSASVVPNSFPTIRIFEYNITGLSEVGGIVVPPAHFDIPDSRHEDEEILKKKKYKFEIPDSPSKSSPPGPAYSPQTFSLLRYRQYLANLTYINNDFVSSSQISARQEDELKEQKWKEGKHKGEKPHDKDYTPKPKKFKFELHYDTKEDDVYQLEDLTMPNLVDLARRVGSFVAEEGYEVEDGLGLLEKDETSDTDIAKDKKKKDKKKKKEEEKKKRREANRVWFTFVQRAYVETLDPDELKDEFGS